MNNQENLSELDDRAAEMKSKQSWIVDFAREFENNCTKIESITFWQKWKFIMIITLIVLGAISLVAVTIMIKYWKRQLMIIIVWLKFIWSLVDIRVLFLHASRQVFHLYSAVTLYTWIHYIFTERLKNSKRLQFHKPTWVLALEFTKAVFFNNNFSEAFSVYFCHPSKLNDSIAV